MSLVINEAPSQQTMPSARPSLIAPLRVRNFRLLWAGESISLLGDQFYLVALPWLVLQLTGSGLAVGTVLGVAGVPRAVFMLVGGALTDRLSPRWLMFLSNALRLILTLVLTILVLTQTLQLWMLYIAALIFGTVDAFFIPAQTAIVPAILERDLLESGNAITQITAQLSGFVGPALAGLVIAGFAGNAVQAAANAAGENARGIGFSFGFDALTFLVAAAALWMMTGKMKEKAKNDDPAQAQNLLGAIREGIGYVWQDKLLRITIFMTTAANFLFGGPIGVGIPALAARRFPEEGAVAFGFILSAFSLGALLGAVLAGSLPRPRRLGLVVYGLLAAGGLGLMLFGMVSNLPVASLVGVGIGMIVGYVNVTMITWLQKRIEPTLMGRVSSLLMLGAFGLQPISNMIAGVLVDVSLVALFAGAGGLLAILALALVANREIRAMGS